MLNSNARVWIVNDGGCLLEKLLTLYQNLVSQSFFFNFTSLCMCVGICDLSTVTFWFVLQVLQHVRLPLLSPKFLVGTVGSDPLIKSDEECR